MARLRVVEIAPSSVAHPAARRPPARVASPVLSAQQAWVDKQRQLADARAGAAQPPRSPSVPTPPPAPPPPPSRPIVAIEETLVPDAAPAARGEASATVSEDSDAEVWFGPWLPRPGRFPLASVDVTKLPPLGVPVLLPAIDAPDELLAEALATALGELEPSPRLLIERVIGHVGPDGARALYEKTRRKESEGGAGVYDRRRTSGGIFFSLVERQMGWRPFLQASVLAALTVGIVPGPSKRKKR